MADRIYKRKRWKFTDNRRYQGKMEGIFLAELVSKEYRETENTKQTSRRLNITGISKIKITLEVKEEIRKLQIGRNTGYDGISSEVMKQMRKGEEYLLLGML